MATIKTKRVALILGTASMLMLFQNCSQPDSTVDEVGMKLGSSYSNPPESSYTGPWMTPGEASPNPPGLPNPTGLPNPIGTPPNQPESSPGILSSGELRQIEITINSYYRQYLGRDADRDGLIYYIYQHQQGLSFSKIAQSIRNSVEAKVRGFYVRYLQREPDEPGRDYWMDQAYMGRSLAQIELDFRYSDECKVSCL